VLNIKQINVYNVKNNMICFMDHVNLKTALIGLMINVILVNKVIKIKVVFV